MDTTVAVNSASKAALLERVAELKRKVREYERLAHRSMKMLQFAGAVALASGIAASLIALFSPSGRWKAAQVILPLLCPLAALWAVRRYKHLAFRAYLRSAYTDLFRHAEAQVPLATTDAITTQVHDHLNREMSRIQSDEEAMNLAFLHAGHHPRRKKSAKLQFP